MLCDKHGIPLAYQLSPGQCSDVSQAVSLLERVRLPSAGPGRPRTRCHWLLGDKGYDSDSLRRHCRDHGIRAVIPYRRMRRRPRRGLPYQFDKPLYRKRNAVERLLGWLKEKRHLTTRFDKLESSFQAMITLGCILKCARAYFSYRA